MERVLVGISGGVDSAVCAYLLKKQGYDVVGAMMRVYSGEIKNTIANSCYGSNKEKEIIDAKENCKVIGCDFHLIDCSCEFNELVFKRFKNDYLNARTPNPCVLCNPNIKFGVFPKKAREEGILFDKFATGHYAKCEFDENLGKFLLKRGENKKKDQSYFLYALTQQKLSKILFPLGALQKEDVRKIAQENNIPVAKKKDSQDFYAGSYSEILDVEENKGEIVDTKGNVLGEHKGLFNYTIGQRKGILISYSEPLYVVDFDTKNNRLIVGTKENVFSKGLIANELNWTYFEEFNKPIVATAKIRSAGEPTECEITPVDKNNVKVIFKNEQSGVAAGQAVVFYDNDTVLGGGTILSSIK